MAMELMTERLCSMARAGWSRKRSSSRSTSSRLRSSSGLSFTRKQASRSSCPMKGVSRMRVSSRNTVFSAATVTEVMVSCRKGMGQMALAA